VSGLAVKGGGQLMAGDEAPAPVTARTRPRLGFLGVGWIGRHRLEAITGWGAADVVGIVDASAEAADAAAALAPDAAVVGSLDELLALGVDGVVIATPSALHAEQAVRALEAGAAVFCQKPLARTAAETRRVVDAARTADRLLGVDLSYRHVQGVRRIRDLIAAGTLGDIYAVDLVFHNAYGPDKPWFRDARLSGGGCVIDLGIHLVDLALWTLDFPAVGEVRGRLFAGGVRLPADPDVVEDHAVAEIELGERTAVRLTCSWNAHAGQDAVIEALFYGTAGGAALRNTAGSFYDFVAEHYRGTTRETVAAPPDAWGGRAAVAWAEALAAGGRFDEAAATLVPVAEVLDRIYGR
jgi:predicted dehydrogenase